MFWTPRVVVFALACGLLMAAAPSSAVLRAAEPEIRIVADEAGGPVAFEAVGLAAAELADVAKRPDANGRLARLFAVYVTPGQATQDLPPIVGRYAVDGSTLRFTPRFPFSPGLRYRVLLRPAELKLNSDQTLPPSSQGSVTREIEIPEAKASEPTEITAIYPSAATLPENNLRFYLHFSASMARGAAYEYVRLIDAAGAAVEVPFLEIGEELWDPRARRFTLIIDPGRVKQGVKPREDLGPVLEAGKEYTLIASREWRDASGHRLKGDFKKRFRVGPPIATAIDTAQWKVSAPAPATNSPVTLRFPKPLDHAMLSRTIHVTAADGSVVKGRVAVSEEERRWELVPDSPWRPGPYQLVIDTALEDLAGNRIGHPFEADRLDAIEKQIDLEAVRIPFAVSSSAAAER